VTESRKETLGALLCLFFLEISTPWPSEMCRSFTVTFTCTATHPTHRRSFSQSCPKCKPKIESKPESEDGPHPKPGSPTGLSLSLSRSISRALEPKPDPAALRGYTLAANRACEVCDPERRPVAEPPDLNGRHTLSVEEGVRECAALQSWAEGL